VTNQYEARDEASGGGFFNHLPGILWQRRWFVIPPLVLLAAAGLIAALLLPTIYRSSATLLVQSQQLPTAVADSPSGALIDQRIAKIRQQVLSRGDLIAAIEQNGLYEEERRSRSLSEIVDEMRSNVAVQAVTGDIGQQPSGNQSNTIAFTMSFDYRDPVKAQAVMQNFVQRFLELDTSNMEQRATQTVAFLQDQATRLRRQISAIENQTTAIKARNGLAIVNTGLPTASDSGGYQAQIISLQNENRALRLQAQRAAENPVVKAAEAQLDVARATYNEDHPDVRLAKQRVAELRRTSSESAGSTDRERSVETLRAQIAANNNTIATLEAARSQAAARASANLATQARGPAILEQVAQLDSQANILRQQYQDVADALLKAEGSARITEEQKGERLSVVEPPVVPDEPTSPNRPLLIVGGIAAGLGLGVVLALAVELMLKPVRGVESIEDLGLSVLGVVPTFKSDRSSRKRQTRSARGEVMGAAST
jgi:uncharacterized protein involved in exopolysaccharide biosynthesis